MTDSLEKEMVDVGESCVIKRNKQVFLEVQVWQKEIH